MYILLKFRRWQFPGIKKNELKKNGEVEITIEKYMLRLCREDASEAVIL